VISKLLALLLIVVLSPIFAIIAFLIFIEDGRPVFFIQKRIGVKNSTFNMFKFRTMKKDTPNIATHLLIDPEKYLLRIGKVLRKLSFDELPNLINIIKGEMVFVGPRPALFNQYDLMELRTKYGIEKLKPGITGWAQINGRDEISIQKKVSLEQEYLNKKSLLFDVKIFFLTFVSVFKSEGITH